MNWLLGSSKPTATGCHRAQTSCAGPWLDWWWLPRAVRVYLLQEIGDALAEPRVAEGDAEEAVILGVEPVVLPLPHVPDVKDLSNSNESIQALEARGKKLFVGQPLGHLVRWQHREVSQEIYHRLSKES